MKKKTFIWSGLLVCLIVAGAVYATTQISRNHTSESSHVKQVTATTSHSTGETISGLTVETSTVQNSSSTNEVTTKASSKSSVTSEPQVALQTAIDDLKASATQVQYGVYYFSDGKQITSQNSAPTVSASVIKVFIMDYAFAQITSGALSEATLVNGRPLIDWITPMIQKSDNDATNVLIDYFGMDPLNEYFHSRGYNDTRLERHMLDSKARASGKENYTSLNDCLAFLKQLYEKQTEVPESEMLTIMKGQTVRTKLPSQLPADIIVANKTGELESVENDIGIIFAPDKPFAAVVLTNGSSNTAQTRQAIGEFALAAFHTN